MKNVLLVENDLDLLFPLEVLLRVQGYQVTTATNEQEALAVYNPDFDYILCEGDLPGLNVSRLLQAWKRIGKLPFCILFLSHITNSIFSGAIELGVTCTIKKPIEHIVLQATLLALSKKNKVFCLDVSQILSSFLGNSFL